MEPRAVVQLVSRKPPLSYPADPRERGNKDELWYPVLMLCYRTPKSWHYIPFNGGPRICVAQQFALAEMGYALARIFQKFGGIEPRATEKQFPKYDVVMAPGVAVQVAFKLASDG